MQEQQTVHIVPYITDRELPEGNRVMVRDRPARVCDLGDHCPDVPCVGVRCDPPGTERVVEAFVHRPALLADPEGVFRDYIEATDVIAQRFNPAAARTAAVDLRRRVVSVVLQSRFAPLATAAALMLAFSAHASAIGLVGRG